MSQRISCIEEYLHFGCYHFVEAAIYVFTCWINRHLDSGKGKKKADVKRKYGANSSTHCEICREKQKKLEEAEHNVKDLTDELGDCHERIASLNDSNKELILRNDRLNKCSNEITRKMADVLETKGELENPADDFSNTRLSRRFEKDIYDKRWVSLFEWFVDDLGMSEQQVIPFLSKMLQEAYNLCVQQADDQIRRFFFLGENGVIPAESENPYLYKCRRHGGQSKEQREHISKTVVDKLLNNDEINSFLGDQANEEAVGKLERFFTEFADYCWLMTISHPPLVLNFDVVGMTYAGKLTERFLKYSTQETVIERTKCKGTILHVVWPSVSTKNGNTVYAKGSVITVDDTA